MIPKSIIEGNEYGKEINEKSIVEQQWVFRIIYELTQKCMKIKCHYKKSIANFPVLLNQFIKDS